MVRLARTWVWVLAVLALTLQVNAVVKSAVMTAAPDAVMSMPEMAMPETAMAGMDMAAAPMCGGGAAGAAHRPAKSARTCPYCADAVQPPLAAAPPPLPVCGRAEFTAYTTLAWRGPRGPPARRPRARDPPLPA